MTYCPWARTQACRPGHGSTKDGPAGIPTTAEGEGPVVIGARGLGHGPLRIYKGEPFLGTRGTLLMPLPGEFHFGKTVLKSNFQIGKVTQPPFSVGQEL